MQSTIGHGPRRAVLYARVSTDEQARSGYSLAQQLEALREYAVRERYEVLEEVEDAGHSGATLERPGMDRVRDIVAEGSVSLVLAQDRDRFAREPAYHYLLRREFEACGTKIRALNDRGDDSPEGELTDGILDQLAKYERAKIAERSRRGKMRKAREGKVIAGRMLKYGSAKYGFGFNEARDGLVVDEETMAVVRRMFYMVGVARRTIYSVKRVLDAEGVPTATGRASWAAPVIRGFLLDDVYKPHDHAEIGALAAAGQLSTDVAARLDPDRSYGIWWFNRYRHKVTQVSEPGPAGRVYRRKQVRELRPREEWIAVPVPDPGVPREWVDAAREAVKNNRRPSNAGRRPWELSGGIVRCGACGYAMSPATSRERHGHVYFYYACRTRYKKGPEVCPKAKHLPAPGLEARVWEEVSGALTNPEQLRADLDRMIEQERAGGHGDPAGEAKLWADKLADVERKRARYQEMAVNDLITFDELRSRLGQLDETRGIAERELGALRRREEHLESLEQDRDALIESLVRITPEALEGLTPEERHRFYKMLRLEVIARPDGALELGWAGSPEMVSPSAAGGTELSTLEVSR